MRGLTDKGADLSLDPADECHAEFTRKTAAPDTEMQRSPRRELPFMDANPKPPPFGWRVRLLIALRRFLGTLLTFNFAVLWAAPVIIQGQLFRRGLGSALRPVHRLLDASPALRRFAARHVYRRPVHVDYFASAILVTAGTATALSVLFGWQIAFRSLPWWLVAIYYFLWVGPGGRSMAAAYTFAHREGHLPGGRLYQPWIGELIGNFFENWMGLWYGNVPYNFSTSHVLLHHRLDGGKGDPIYLWDIDRTKFADVMLYQWRMFRYMTGFSGLAEFRRQQGVLPAIDRAFATLRRGMLIYWICVPAAILAVLTASGSSIPSALLFLFLIYFQPLCAMACFLALMNLGWHGFLEFDDAGRHVKHVTSGTIIDGFDDSFGEDYHVAHHHFPAIGHDKLSKHVASERQAWARCHGAVFGKTTIFDLAIMMHVGQFDRLIRNHYMDFAGDLEPQQLADLFERRAKRKEMSYEEYEFRYLPRLRGLVRDLVSCGTCGNENQGYLYQSHCNLQSDLSIRLS